MYSIHVDGKGGERPIDSRDRPGGMQLIWQQQNLANQKLVVTFSEASKESIRQSVNKRRSSTADALDRHLGLAAAAAAAPAAGGGANSAAINSIDDDLAALDAIAADFATPVLPNVSAAAAAAKKPAVLVPATSAASKSRAAKPRLKIVPIGEDAEYQGLLAALKANRPAAAAAPASLDDFDSIMVGIDGGDSGGAHGGASRSADLVALEEFGLTDDDFNALPAANDNSDTGKKKAAAPHSDAFAEIDGALSFALSGLDDIAIAESAAGDGIDIDFDAMLAQLSKDSDQLTHEMSKH